MRLPRELHRSDRPSITARWTTMIRALELHRPPAQRIVTDEYAPAFLSPLDRATLAPLGLAAPLLRPVERWEAAGLATFVLCRHAMLDEHLVRGLRSGAEQVLVLGAGYDSRAYRFAGELAGRAVFEVDLPPLSRYKAGLVAARPDLFGGGAVRRVELDFRTGSLADALAGAGFVRDATTVVVWEGVSPYLSGAAVKETVGVLGAVCGPGSLLAMDFWTGSPGSGPLGPVRRLAAQAFGLIGEPVTFGIGPGRVGDFLGGCGFRVADLADAAGLTERYATDGRRCEQSLYVLAARLD